MTVPGAEQARLAALHRLGVLNTPADTELDEVVTLAARLFDAPTALVTLIDADRQSFKSKVGIEMTGSARDIAFCDHTIRQPGVLLVEDATVDERFRDNPLVIGEPRIRFYAGAPLVTSDGAAIGSLCVLGPEARTATLYQQAMLVALADQVVRHLENTPGTPAPVSQAPAEVADPATDDVHFRRLLLNGSTGYVRSTDEGTIIAINPAASRMLGYEPEELLGRPVRQLAHPDHVSDIDGAFAGLRTGDRTSHEATRVYLHKTGRPVPLLCTVSYQASTATRPASVAALLIDLSARVISESHRLGAVQDREQVLEAATDAYIALDGDGLVRGWNAAAERTFGYTARQALGQDLADLIVPEDTRGAHIAGVRRLISGGTPHLIGTSVEVLARHRDGHPLHIELTPWRATGKDGTEGFHAFCRDIDERVTARAALLNANELLRQGQEQLRSAFAASTSADAVLDNRGVLLDVNPQMCRLLHRTSQELIGRRLTQFVAEPDVVQAAVAMTRIEAAAPDRTELRFTTGDGRVVWGLASLTPMVGRTVTTPDKQTGDTGAARSPGDNDGPRAVLRVESLQVYKELESKLARQSTHDALTGLPNRGLLLERARQAVVAAGAENIVAAVVIRMDGLRELINTCGFTVGDKALEELAERLRTVTPDDVSLAHMQPGLFAAVVPAGNAAAARAAGRYLSAVSAPMAGMAGTVPLRASIGISSDDATGGDAQTRIGRLLQSAEDAARVASTQGGNTVVFAAPEMHAAQQRQQQLEAVIRQALDEHHVELAFQPVFDLATSRIVGAEALLRLTDDSGRPLSALEVVTAAETSGQIIELGARILTLAAEQSAQWQRDHGFLVPIAVNVSAVQLRRPSFVAGVLAALDEARVPAAALTLELTESVLLTSGSDGMAMLVALRDAGVHLAIDDFGTGYASLTYLRDLPATTLKVDRSFVDGIPDDRSAMAIVRGVIDLASGFGMVCIAEGIETEAQRAYLAGRGVLGQGYLLCRPTDATSVSRLIAEHGADPALSAVPVSAADARDQAGVRRDVAGHDRDEAGSERDHVGDLRDRLGDQRDLLADRRDQAGNRRDHAADDRDDLAEERDRAGARRDEAAGQRDLDDEADGGLGEPRAAARRDRPDLARLAARADRDRALQDREAGASERALAGRDRTNALADRSAGALERAQSEHDRNTSSDDRGLGAGERALSQDDRTTAESDRDASARDRDLSFLDPLTGAHARGPGLMQLGDEVTRALRTGASLLVVYVDIDHLKRTNDSEGHAAGDEVIRSVGHALLTNLRSYDLVVRIGGDEFLCALSGTTAADVAARLAAASSALASLPRRASFTAGLTELLPGDTMEELVNRADADLYDRRRSRPPRAS